MLEYTPIAQFAIGTDHKVKVWNKACEVLTGVSAEEIVGTDEQWKIFYPKKRPILADLVVEQDYEKFLEKYGTKNPAQSNIVPNAWEATDYFENFNGKPRYIYFMAAPVFDDEGNITGAVTTLQDITLRKLQEDAMKRESEQLHYGCKGNRNRPSKSGGLCCSGSGRCRHWRKSPGRYRKHCPQSIGK